MSAGEDRRRLVQAAQSIEESGAHYLTLAFGGIPGQGPDPIHHRSLRLVNNYTWNQLAVCTAEFNGLFCCGRYQSPARKLSRPGGTPPPADLARWIETASRTPDAPAPFQGLYYPRRHVLDRRHCPPRQTPDQCDPQWLYLGESCVGKMHFDCFGFVAYAFLQATGRPGFWTQQTLRQDWLSDRSRVQPGDVVLAPSYTHIAIVVDQNRIIHAAGDIWGVKTEPWRLEYSLVYHLPDSAFARSGAAAAVAVP